MPLREELYRNKASEFVLPRFEVWVKNESVRENYYSTHNELNCILGLFGLPVISTDNLLLEVLADRSFYTSDLPLCKYYPKTDGAFFIPTEWFC
jgi:hypothetical protein